MIILMNDDNDNDFLEVGDDNHDDDIISDKL